MKLFIQIRLKDLYLNQFIKSSTEIQFLKWDLENFTDQIANLKSEKVIDTWTNILLLHRLVLLIAHNLPSLIMNNENQIKNTAFWEDTQNIPLAPINMKRLFLKFSF